VIFSSTTALNEFFLVFGSLMNLKFANISLIQNKKNTKNIQLNNIQENITTTLNSY
jgi:hypothetical protein